MGTDVVSAVENRHRTPDETGAMGPSQNETEEHVSLDLYDPDEGKAPMALLWVALVHCYCVAIVGSIGKCFSTRHYKVR